MNARAYTGAGSVSIAPSSSALMYLLEMRVSRSTSVSVSPRAVLAWVSAFPSSCVDMQWGLMPTISSVVFAGKRNARSDVDRKCYVVDDQHARSDPRRHDREVVAR